MADGKVELRGARVTLRPFNASDITPEYLAWLSDDRVNQYSRRLGMPRQTVADADRWLASLGEGEEVFAIQEKRLRYIGTIKYGPIRQSNLSADVAILVGAVESWGRGLGGEATYLLSKFLFFERGLNRLHAASINPAFVRMVERLGWQREGVLREETRVGGQFYDSVLVSFLKRDFLIVPDYEANGE